MFTSRFFVNVLSHLPDNLDAETAMNSLTLPKKCVSSATRSRLLSSLTQTLPLICHLHKMPFVENHFYVYFC